MANSDLESDIRTLKRLCAWILAVLVALLALHIWYQRTSWRQNRFRDEWYETAKTYLFERDWMGLGDHANAWMKKEPDSDYATWYRGVALYQMKDYAGATAAFRRAKRMNPTWSERTDYYLAMCAQLSPSAEKKGEPVAPAGRR